MAKKPTITSITSGYASTNTLNDNFEALRDAFDNTLSLDGSTPNSMTSDLNLNNNDILNASRILVGGVDYIATALSYKNDAETAKTAAETAQAAAELVYDNFDDRYLGSKASDPTVDNDGDALLDGALYYDTINTVMKFYDTSTSTWYRTTPTTSDQANIDIVAGNTTNINTVAGISSDVTTVAGISSDVTTVAADGTDIGTVATSISNVNTAATNISNINTVAGISANVTTVAGNTSNINTVATDISNVNTVAGQTTNLQNVTDNLTAIQNAATNATNAATSASNAATSETNAATSASNASTSETNAASSATAAAASAAAAEASADFFDDVYLGSKASDPSVDNDGDALNAGDLYFNTTSNTMRVYSGSAWQDAAVDSSGFVQTTGDTMTGDLDIQGTLTSDGLTSNKNINSTTVPTARSDYQISVEVDGAHTGDYVGGIAFGDQALSTAQAAILVADRGASAATGLSIATGNSAAITQRMRIDDIGDISFYEDTGTTAKFFWDAAAESLGIGTSSPLSILDVKNATNEHIVVTGSSTYGNNAIVGVNDSGGEVGLGLGGNTIEFYTAATERMRLDASGVVNIKNTGSTADFISETATSFIVGDGTGAQAMTVYTGTASNGAIYFADGSTGNATYRGGVQYLHGSDAMRFFTSATEVMRIDSSGALLVGSTTASGQYNGTGNNGMSVVNAGQAGQYVPIQNETDSNIYLSKKSGYTDNRVLNFAVAGTSVGTVTVTGSATAYNTSSDHRLKENVVDLTGATARLKQLEPKRFNFIADADTTVDGFLAHEVQSVVPEAITGTHNEVDDDGNPVYQGIDQSKLVPLLVATIKELEARITALENA